MKQKWIAISKSYWPYGVLLLFLLFQFGDVLFSQGSLNPLPQTPAACTTPLDCLYTIPPYHGWLEDSWLNRFPPQKTSDKALWDRPMVYDPHFKAESDLLKAGEFPWLNPYNGLGVPLFANGVSAAFSLPQLAFAFIPLSHWDWVYLALFGGAGIAVYRMLRVFWRFSAFASTAGTLLYLGSAIFCTQMAFGGESFNIYCFTFGLYFLEAFRQADSFRAQKWAALGLTLCLIQSVYVGMPEGTVANFLMLGGYLLLRWPLSSWPQARATLLWGTGCFGSALLLSAPYLSTLYGYTHLMNHAHEIGHATIPWIDLPSVILPYFRGWLFSNFAPDEFPNHMNAIFVGIMPWFAGILWATHYRQIPFQRGDWGWGVCILFYLSQSFGNEFFSLNMVGSLPIVKQIWFFRFFAPLYVWSLVLLTVRVLEALLTLNWQWSRLVWGLAINLAGYLMWLRFSALHSAALRHDDSLALALLQWNQVNTGGIWACTLLFAAWGWCASRYQWAKYYFPSLCLILIFLLTSWHFSKSFYRRSESFQQLPSVAFLHQQEALHGPFRIYAPQLYFPSTSAGYRLSDLRYMAPIVPETTVQVLQAVFGEAAEGQVWWDRFEYLREVPRLYEHPGFDFFNVRYFLFSQQRAGSLPAHPTLQEVYHDEQVIILENKNVLPRFFLVETWEVLPEQALLVAQVRQAPQDLAQKAWLETDPQWPKLPTSSVEGPAQIRLLHKQNAAYHWEVHLPQAQILIVSDAFMPGYQASALGSTWPVQKANGGVIALPLPAGHYTLTLEFRPPGIWLSWLALGVGVGIGITGLIWRKSGVA